MTFKFDYQDRYDATVAETGVWFAVNDELNQHHGSFKLAFIEPGSPRAVAFFEKKNLNNKVVHVGNGFRTAPTLSKAEEQAEKERKERENISDWLEMTMLDWKGIKAGGKEVPFSLEAACAFFDPNRPIANYIFNALREHSMNVLNFQPEGQTEVPEKN